MKGFLAAILCASLVLTEAIPATAAPRFWVTDTPEKPGASCHYTINRYLGMDVFESMWVRAPEIRWVGTSPSKTNERGTVGWRVRLQRRLSTTWRTVKTSKVVKGTATERLPAALRAITIRPDATYPDGSVEWRAVVVLIWYKPNGKALSKVSGIISNYRDGSMLGQVTSDYCGYIDDVDDDFGW